jgi:hypothetical protein
MDVGYGDSKVPLLFMLESIGDLEGAHQLILMALQFVPFGVAVWALLLLRPETSPETIGTAPTQMGQILGSIVPVTVVVAVIPYMEDIEGEGLLVIGVMVGFSIVYIFGAMAGLALLGMPEEQEIAS